MKINAEIRGNMLADSPLSSSFLHASIICGALTYCIGNARGMSYIKLGYIFDKTLAREDGAFDSKLTLLPWKISLAYKKALILCQANRFIDMTSASDGEVKLSIAGQGVFFLTEAERLGSFCQYINFLKGVSLPENRFKNITIRSNPNVY
jgi:hypothetical protein